MTNLTAYGTTFSGIFLDVDWQGVGSIFNSISYGFANNIITAGPVALGFNLSGIDPRFINPSFGDFDLRSDSPALDAGTVSPPLLFSPYDVRRRPRIINYVDIGAYERQ